MITLPEKAKRPTIYFIGVTTGRSSIMDVFPRWAAALGLKNAGIKGIDMPLHAPAEDYRAVVDFIKNDPLSYGALVTTHKIDLFKAAEDMFDYLDPYAKMFGELSSISKQNGRLEGYAKDPISSGLSLDSFIPMNFWKDNGGELFIMGAGCSAIAICSYLLDPKRFGENIPSRVVVANRSEPRLLEIKRIVASFINPGVPSSWELTPTPGMNNAVLKKIKPYSLIINATGLGKDTPGSPLLDPCEFPENSLVWEINYRGNLVFMDQAAAQKETKNLYIEDGWTYFIHGWTQVVAEVFHTDITGDRFDICERIARDVRDGNK